MPNAFAYLALFLSIPLGIGVFFVLRPPRAALLVFLGIVMFGPERTALDLPGLPGIGKQEAAALACLAGALLRSRKSLRQARIFRGPDRWGLLLIVGGIATVFNNGEPLQYGAVTLPGLTANEAVSVSFVNFVTVLLPFFIGRALFTSTRDLEQALAALVIAALIYSPFFFTELMLSPQMHFWVYGFYQHEFSQTLRGGGYRPMVFMAHGLAASMVLVYALLAAVALHRARRGVLGLPALLSSAYSGGFLLAVKSLGAALYGAVLAPVVWFASGRTLLRVSLFLALVTASYPLLRSLDVFPERSLVSFAYSLSGDRAESLDFRFTMERMLAERAAEKRWLGWGRFNRSGVFNEEGRQLSVSDGHWIIQYGQSGVVGLVAFFALLLSPIALLRKRVSRVEERRERLLLGGLAIIVAVAAVDLLPNGLFTSIPLFLAGILHGVTRGLSERPPTTSPEAAPVIRRVA